MNATFTSLLVSCRMHVRNAIPVVCIMHMNCGGTSLPAENATVAVKAEPPSSDAGVVPSAPAMLVVPPAGTLGVGTFADCGIVAGGTLRCWRQPATPPYTVEDETGAPITDATFLSAGDHHRCVVRKNGSVWCFGSNGANALGRMTGRVRDFPRAIEVRGLADVSSVEVRASSSCAIANDGKAFCWGALDKWLNGAPFDQSKPTPQHLLTFDVTKPHGLRPYYGALVRWQGRELAWRGGDRTLPVADGTSVLRGEIREFLRGDDFGCAVFMDGSVDCSGDSSRREVLTYAIKELRHPDGSYDVDRFVTVPDEAGRPLAGVVRIAVGYDHACVLRSSGDVLCWGANGSGEVGDGEHASRVLPHVVLSGASDLACAAHRCCARKAKDHILCWGLVREIDGMGQPAPTDVPGL